MKYTEETLFVVRYWTDNGACYYHTTGTQYSNYEDLLVAVKEDADAKEIPFRYVQVNEVDKNFN